MGQKSALERLPVSVREYLDECLQNPALTHKGVTEEVNDYLVEELGLKPVITERIVQRYNANQKKAKEELKRNQEITKQIVKHIGDVSLGNMGKGIAAIVGNIAFEVISEIELNAGVDPEKTPINKVEMVKDLVSIAKGINETAAISLSNEAKQEARDKAKRGEKIIPHEELDEIYEEQLQQQAALQAKIANRKAKEDDGDYLEFDE